MKIASLSLLALAGTLSAAQLVTLPSQSPLVTVRIVMMAGSAQDPADKFGLASLTAAMIAEGGSAKRTYQQRVDALYPFASEIEWQVDKEMTTFSVVTHVDNLETVYDLFREAIIEPGWRAEDLTRLRDQQINSLRVNLRSNNDEELGKEVLYNQIYAGHPYGHHNLGTVSAVEKITLDDLKNFYKAQYVQPRLIIGLAGGYPKEMPKRVDKDFSKLPNVVPEPAVRPEVKRIPGLHLTLIDKKTRGVAISFGFPISIIRGDPDFLPLLVAQTYLGQHRQSVGRLYQRIREARGLNYGDYAYIEYFPNGMFRFEPAPNLGRYEQIFQIWIRPLEPPTAHFGLRLALFEFDRFLREGLSAEEFETTRSFLSKNVNLLTKTKRAELGYAIDSKFYGVSEYTEYVKKGLAKMTRDDVNRAIKKYLQSKDMQIVMIADNANQWREKLLANQPSPMKYNSAKPQALLDEDKLVEKLPIPLKPENIKVVPVDTVFE